MPDGWREARRVGLIAGQIDDEWIVVENKELTGRGRWMDGRLTF